jgi:hypothetical protein
VTASQLFKPEDVMKQLRQICGTFVLVLALSITAFAGDISTPGIAGETQTPPCAPGETASPPCVAGETQGPPSVAGETQGPGIAGDILGPGLNFLLSIFY